MSLAFGTATALCAAVAGARATHDRRFRRTRQLWLSGLGKRQAEMALENVGDVGGAGAATPPACMTSSTHSASASTAASRAMGAVASILDIALPCRCPRLYERKSIGVKSYRLRDSRGVA